MKKIYALIISVSISFFATAQLTWSDDVANVFYTNCTYCHNPTGIAPFSLVNYQDAFDFRLSISPAVANGIMPPWTADTTYQRYSHERLLSATEKSTILNWIAQGAPEGNAANTPPPPVYSNDGFLTQTPDLELQMPTYTSAATSTHDDYVCFSVPTGLLGNKKIKAFEVIPGNTSIVHHALVYVDKSGVYPTDTTSGFCNGPTDENTTDLLGGYTPGALPTVFPGQGNVNFGYTLEAGSNIVLAMHYPEGSAGLKDSTKLRLYFYDDATSIREVKSAPVLSNWNFTIPANTISPVSDTYNLPIDVSLLSVFPHMHLLGNSIESYSVTPTNDTIPLVRINHWDFDWQEFLFFEYIKKIPANSTLYGNATYDNTTNNHHNPNNPPIDVSAGLNTSDEMFLIYFHFAFYQQGDENLNLDSLTNDFYSVQVAEYNKDSQVKVYPNPTAGKTTIEFLSNKNSTASVFIYDISGKLVTKLLDKQQVNKGLTSVTWSGRDANGTTANPGIYFYSIVNDGEYFSGKILKIQAN